jgi:hypothetical protein
VAARVTSLHHSLFALETQHGPSFSLSLLMQVHEAAAVVESGDAVATRWRSAAASVRAAKAARVWLDNDVLGYPSAAWSKQSLAGG